MDVNRDILEEGVGTQVPCKRSHLGQRIAADDPDAGLDRVAVVGVVGWADQGNIQCLHAEVGNSFSISPHSLLHDFRRHDIHNASSQMAGGRAILPPS